MSRQKPMTKVRNRSKIDMDVPQSLYHDFRQLLREQLAEDDSFKAAYLAKVFESKLLDPELSGVSDRERRERAITKWLAREALNRDTNRRIMHADETDFLFLDRNGFPVFATDMIAWCRTEISRLLGETVPWDELRGSFSGGAATSIRRGVGVIPKKYQEGKDITGGAIWHYLRLTQSVVALPRDLNVVPGNVLFTVPKTSEIDRVACKEPDLNMYCQKAVGDYIRKRLKTKGIDLDNQKTNQRLAKKGSDYWKGWTERDNLCTIDLSSASDSVTKQLVIALLPFEWSSLLMDLRSPVTVIDGHEHLNEMISSMGNAFTFELESLIFWALVRGVAYFTRTRGRVSVYGDDIICHSGLYYDVESTLEFFGFSMNTEKSFAHHGRTPLAGFWDGQFRESCGKHWFNGLEVTPFYVKSIPRTVSDWCLLLNSLRSWSNVGGICDPRYYDLWSLYSTLIPKPLHGARDLSRRDALVAPGRRNIARIVLKQHEDKRVRDAYQHGAYLAWLDTTKDRTRQNYRWTSGRTEEVFHGYVNPANDHLVATPTDYFRGISAYETLWSYNPNCWDAVGIPTFPQEL